MYDFIGDIHGYCSRLEQLLTKMQYEKVNGAWKHAERKVIFVGDYIDRGPEIRETLQMVRNMVESGAAIALMGNHEYNALAFDTQTEGGGYLRTHNAAHSKQHEQTLAQFADHGDDWQSYLKWFYTLPLFANLGELRAVHACWDDAHIEWLKANGHERMSLQLLHDSHVKGSKAYEVINETLKGKEFNIPEAYTWYDKDGHARNANRIKWWIDPKQAGYGEFLFNCPDELAASKFPSALKVNIYPAAAPPVFFGHYWLEDKFPVMQSHNVICLDYSVAKGGSLVGYRWSGETNLERGHFVSV